MSLNLNAVQCAGNLTRDPEAKEFSGKTVAKFGIALNRKWKNKEGEWQEEPCFIDCEAWGDTAKRICERAGKGSKVYLSGRLKMDTWEKDGQKRSKLLLAVDSVQFLDPKAEGSAPKSAAAPAPAPVVKPVTEEEPIPF